MKYEYQDLPEYVTVWTDTDYAGCRRTRKSTSGGLVTLGDHVLKTWSQTQAVIALSSGEAEYYGLVRGAANGQGLVSLINDFGIQRKLRVKTDAPVAKSIASRRGVGKIRHIEVNQLWLQEKAAQGEVKIHKIPGDENPADILTKHVENAK